MINTIPSVLPGPADSFSFFGTKSHTEKSPTLSSHTDECLHCSYLNFQLFSFFLFSLMLSVQSEYKHRDVLIDMKFCPVLDPFHISGVSSFVIICCLVNIVLRSSVWYVSPWALCLWPSVSKSMLKCKHRNLFCYLSLDTHFFLFWKHTVFVFFYGSYITEYRIKYKKRPSSNTLSPLLFYNKWWLL